MSSASSYPRCALDIRPSRRLTAFAALTILAASIAPWLAGLPVMFSVAISLAVFPFALPVWRWARSSLSVAWQPGGRWQLSERDGRQHDDVRLLPGVLVTARLLALHWRCEECGSHFRVALLNDNCDPEALRRLRVRLRATPDTELFGQAGE